MNANPDHERKARIIELVKSLRKRSGLTNAEICTIMGTFMGIYDYGLNNLENKFIGRPTYYPNYEFLDVRALIEAFLKDLSPEQRITSKEAIELFDLTGMNVSYFRLLREIFPSDDFEEAWDEYQAEHGFFERIKEHPLQSHIHDFTIYMDRKTQNFVGRQWVFDRINDFVADHPSGYFFITGDPGIGKTALAAYFTKQHGLIHHFNIRSDGLNKPSFFLENILAQLIVRYNLSYSQLPPHATEDGRILTQVLQQVSQLIQQKAANCILIVDGLDEVVSADLKTGTNPLYLPQTLPDGVYVVVTQREPESDAYRVRLDSDFDELVIKADSSENLKDVEDYIRSTLGWEGIKNYIEQFGWDEDTFVKGLLEKSEGNFVYLYYVLPAIANGDYKDTKLENLPKGLQKFYEEQWVRLRSPDSSMWVDKQLPVLVALTVAYEPLSVDAISHYIKIEPKWVHYVLEAWAAFIHEDIQQYEAELIKQYRLYHKSFFDFISRKDNVANEHVNLQAMHRRFADTMWDDIGGDELFNEL